MNDLKDGIWTIWDEEGEVTKYQDWENGEKVAEGKYIPR